MKKISFLGKLNARFVNNYKKSFVPEIFSTMRFWIYRIKIWKRTQPRELGKTYKRYASRAFRTWVILEYQRITKPEESIIPINDLKYVRPETFRMHTQVLAQSCNVISLSELTSYLDNNEEPPYGTVVITISNGHADAFKHATSLLFDLKMPATWSFPLAYIGSKALLIEDMISTAFHLIHSSGLSFPKLKNLTEAEWKLISTKLDREHRPTPNLISIFYALVRARNHHARYTLLNELGYHLKELSITIPEYEDFMDWEEVFALQNAKFDIIPSLFSHSPITELDDKALTNELHQTRGTLQSLNIPWKKTVGLPLNLYNDISLEKLSRSDVKWCLAGELADQPKLQTKYPKVLPRVTIMENETFARDLFLSKIWNVK